ncbi:MAG: GNVR domain-containing protein [Candidatus Poribacteria bacterium]|nr:GNVR domain-containing protein [Candidatus Poribacteria bacterium]
MEREFKNLMREQVKQETLYALLAQQYEQAKIEEASDEISLAVLDPAIPPVRRSKPNRKLLLLLGGVIGLMLSFGLVITLNLVEKYKDEQSG